VRESQLPEPADAAEQVPEGKIATKVARIFALAD
jgi:hypothetical protein